RGDGANDGGPAAIELLRERVERERDLGQHVEPAREVPPEVDERVDVPADGVARRGEAGRGEALAQPGQPPETPSPKLTTGTSNTCDSWSSTSSSSAVVWIGSPSIVLRHHPTRGATVSQRRST